MFAQEVQASRIARGDKDLSACMLEFGLGCDALSRVDDEINGVTSAGSGENSHSSSKSADRASSLCSSYHEL